jgi:peptide deformylase
MTAWRDNITSIDVPEDVQYLKRPLFHVNMRLFASSPGYKRVIQAACDHLRWLCLTPLEGYKKPHGVSGANAGIPWNIIGIVGDRGRASEHCVIMINPKLVKVSPELVAAESSCGSVPGQRVTVERHAWVKVEWFDEQGRECTNTLTRETSGFTVQHEIDHNLGIIITDRKMNVV